MVFQHERGGILTLGSPATKYKLANVRRGPFLEVVVVEFERTETESSIKLLPAAEIFVMRAPSRFDTRPDAKTRSGGAAGFAWVIGIPESEYSGMVVGFRD